MMVDLHLAVAGEGVGGDFGQPEAASSNGLLAFLTLGRPLSVIDCKTVIGHLLDRYLSNGELELEVKSRIWVLKCVQRGLGYANWLI